MTDAVPEQTLTAIRANADLLIGELGPQSGVTPFGLNEDSVRYVEGFIERQRAQGGDWSGLVGSLNATLTVYASVTGQLWLPRRRGLFLFDAASGTDELVLVREIADQYLQLVYDPVGVTGGTFDCNVYGK